MGVADDDDQPQLLQREGGRVEQLPDMVGHVGIDALVAGGRDGVALDQRTPGERALQRIGRALQPDVRLRRREHDLGRGLRFGLADLDEIARADAGIGALQAVETDDVDVLVLAVRADRARGGRALADDLDHVALGKAELVHQLVGKAGEAAAAVRGRQARNLDLARLSRDRSCRLQAFCLLSRGPGPIAQRRRCRAGSLVQSIFDRPRDFANHRARSEARARRADLVDQPGTTTARFESRPFRPASTTSAAFIATLSNRPLPPNPATSPNSVRVGPGQRQLTLIAVRLQLLVQRFAERQDERLGREIDRHLRARAGRLRSRRR